MNTHHLDYYLQGFFWLVVVVSAPILLLKIKSITSIRNIPDDFVRMINTMYGAESEVTIKYSDFVKAYRDAMGAGYRIIEEDGKNYFEDASSYIVSAIRSTLSEGKSLTIIIDSSDHSSFVRYSLSPSGNPSPENKRFYFGKYMIDRIEINEAFDFVTFSDVIILNVVISAPRGMFSFNGCWIANLEVRLKDGAVVNETNMLHLNNCLVGKMSIFPESIGRLSIEETAICNIRCKGNEHKSPFRELNISHNSQLLSPRVNENGQYFGIFPEDMQALRNFRGHLEARGELSALAVVRSNEMRIERINQDRFMRVINFCYDVISDFGGRPYRPLIWTTFVFSFNIALIYANKWSMTSLDCAKASVLASWQAQLCGDGDWRELARAFFLSAQTIVNPFGIIGGDPPVRATNIMLHLWISLTSFLSIVSLAISFSGIRRQFRLEK